MTCSQMTIPYSDIPALQQNLDAIGVIADGSAYPFAKSLAAENGWAISYAERVFAEYRRFIILAKVNEEGALPISPSDAVDQAWHLHLAYTRSYWNDLCGTFFNKPFHHDPQDTAGDNGLAFLEQYNHTLTLYKITFGEDAPADIWPGVSKRLSKTARFQRLDVNEYSRKLHKGIWMAWFTAVILFGVNIYMNSFGAWWVSSFVYLVCILFLFSWLDIGPSEPGKSNAGAGCGGGGCGGGCGGCGG